MSKQDDELKDWYSLIAGQLSILRHEQIVKIREYIVKHFNPKSDSFTKAEVLRALPEKKAAEDVHVEAINDLTSKVIYKLGYNQAITDFTEALGLTSKEDSHVD